MRLIYVLLVTGILAVGMLWLGKFGVVRKRLAVLVACASLICGGGLLLMAVLPGNSFYGETITSVQLPNGKKLVALTFDDGPYPPYTQKLLAVLEEKQVKATFFMVGNNASQNPEVVTLVTSKGHEVALHAEEHKDFLKLNEQELVGNILRGKKILEELTGKPVKYLRPPHGFRDWAVMEAASDAGLKVVNWSVIPRDWTNPGVQEIADRACKNVAPGAIVLLHDGDAPAQTASREQTVEATALIIDELRKQGYNFVTVSQLLERK
ncbi:MAG: polysaccharide deacetylase family protein [Phascolarctobacterium sp.]|nr:polysaccharide deacetylase family protein [Phascolarctobacterium sp.]